MEKEFFGDEINEPGSGRPEDNMYLLSFMDTTDRLDIILLEIRHLQQSIIDSLRVPTLYLALRYEEQYLFGGWVKENDDILSGSLARISSKFIIRYPAPTESLKRYYGRSCDLSDSEEKEMDSDEIIKSRIKYRLGEIWSGDLWARGEKRNYYALRALQLLKRQVFNDKLALYKYAKKSGLIKDGKNKKTLKRSAFLIIRRGIVYRVNRYISVLRTHQQNFGKSLDFGLLRYPRPSIERRREIGIFNDFLANRSRDIQHDLLNMLYQTVFHGEKKFTEDVNPAFSESHPSMIMHGWSQFLSVRSTQLYDDVGREGGPKYRDVSYIDSSIWTPDRPDLQPLIAREIVRSILRSHVGNLGDNYISNNKNKLTELYVDFSRVTVTYSEKVKVLKPIFEDHDFTKKIIFDLMAVSVKGISYLYALYLEIIGQDLERQLKSDKGVRLDMVNDLEAGVSAYEEDYFWYFRLVLTAYWLEKVLYDECTSIDNTVIKGVIKVSNELLGFLDSNSPKSRDAVGREWRNLIEQQKVVLKNSKLIDQVQKWRTSKSVDTWNDQPKSKLFPTYNWYGESGKKEFHRSTMPLDMRIQNYLFRQILVQKRDRMYKCLNGVSDNKLIVDKFDEKYNLESKKSWIPHFNGKAYCWQPKIFNNLHDIPYQAAILRSMDILSCNQHMTDWRKLVAQMHEDIILGRDLYSFALEFYTWRRDSPKDRLLSCINLITFTLPSLINLIKNDDSTESKNNNLCGEKKHKVEKLYDLSSNELANALFCKLIDWMYADEKGGDYNPEFLYAISSEDINKKIKDVVDFVKTVSHKRLQERCVRRKGGRIVKNGEVEKHGAVFIIAAFSDNTIGKQTSYARRLEQLSGYKLKSLLEKLKEVLEHAIYKNSLSKKSETSSQVDPLIPILRQYDSLIKFLQIRDEEFCDPSSSEHYFYKQLLRAFGDPDEPPEESMKKPSEHYYHKQLLRAFGDTKELSGQSEKKPIKLPKEIKPVMVSRISMSSYYEVSSTFCLRKSSVHERPENDFSGGQSRNALGLSDVLSKGSWRTHLPSLTRHLEWKEKEKEKEQKEKADSKFPDFTTNYINTMGRYDVVSFTPTHLPCKCSISSFSEAYGYVEWTDKEKEDNQKTELKPPFISSEKFVSHFSRREVAMPLEVFSGKEEADEDLSGHDFIPENYSVIMVLSISLQRRSMRLNLLFRLLHAVAEWKKQRKRDEDPRKIDAFAEGSVEALLQSMLPNGFIRIKALLTDGWGDLLLVFFYKKEKLESLAAKGLLEKKAAFLKCFFEFQKAVYEDFMVDRTEMIYTPQTLDALVFRDEKKRVIAGHYRFYFSIRFQEDRKLEHLIEIFHRILLHKSKSKEEGGSRPKWLDEVNIFDMPGAFDTHIYFKINYDEWENHVISIIKPDQKSPGNYNGLHNGFLYAELIKWLQKIDEGNNAGNPLDWYWYRDVLSVIDKIETGVERFVSHNGLKTEEMLRRSNDEATAMEKVMESAMGTAMKKASL